MDRRTFVGLTAAAAAASARLSRTAFAQTAPKARNVVLLHGLFADGSCWSEVIPRLQAAGLNVTSVQNPLTTLPDAVDAVLRVLVRGELGDGGSFARSGSRPPCRREQFHASRKPARRTYR